MTNEQAPAAATFLQVIEAGRVAGYWQVLKIEEPELGPVRYATVQSPEGHRFYLTGPSYAHKDTIGGSVDGLRDSNGLRVDARDVSRVAPPSPRESTKKTPEVIARGLNKRLVQNPEAVALCVAIEDRLKKLQAAHSDLRENMAKLAALGVDFDGRTPHDAHYQAKGYMRGPQGFMVTVYADGRVSFEASTTVGRFADVLAALGTP